MSEGFDDPPRPSGRKVQALLKEVDLSYKRKRRLKHPKSENIRLGQLRRLFRHRRYPEEKIRAVIEDLGDLEAWGRSLGQQVSLRFEELVALRITTFDCFERPPEDVRAFYAEREKERDRLRKRRKRAAEPKKPSGLSTRAIELLTLIADAWVLRSALVEASASLPSFCRRGRPLPKETRKAAVRRAIAELDRYLMVEIDEQTFDERGQRVVAVRRVR